MENTFTQGIFFSNRRTYCLYLEENSKIYVNKFDDDNVFIIFIHKKYPTVQFLKQYITTIFVAPLTKQKYVFYIQSNITFILY